MKIPAGIYSTIILRSRKSPNKDRLCIVNEIISGEHKGKQFKTYMYYPKELQLT